MKEKVSLENNTLIFHREGSKNKSKKIDIIVCKKINMNDIQQIKDNDLLLYCVDFVTETRQYRIGFEDMIELDDWIKQTNHFLPQLDTH